MNDEIKIPENSRNIIKNEIKSFIGEEGLTYFKQIYEKHKTVWVVERGGDIPHSIWFHEGRQIRNHIGKKFSEFYEVILYKFGYNYYEDLIAELVNELIKEEINKDGLENT